MAKIRSEPHAGKSKELALIDQVHCRAANRHRKKEGERS